ncbi:MAG: hypothetical protein ACO1PI_07195 [Bacteroidota bacterium]
MQYTIKKLAIAGLLLLCCLGSYAQSTFDAQKAHENYWNYRNRFKIMFTKIGIDRGNSIPLAERWDDIRGRDKDEDNTGNKFCDSAAGKIGCGDGLSFLGYYLSLLATEYKLLNDAGRPTQATLNELYYAINTLTRVDLNGELFWGFSPDSANLNGFLTRDDFDSSSHLAWKNQLNTTMTGTDGYSKMIFDAATNTCPEKKTAFDGTDINRNVMSQDHLINILMGFSFIKKYVPNVHVKPTSIDRGFNIINEIETITRRLMDYVTATKTIQRTVTKCGSTYTLTETFNWAIVNPFNNDRVSFEKGTELGPLCWAFAKGAERILGADEYSINSIYLRTSHANLICPQWDIGISISGSEYLFRAVPNVRDRLSAVNFNLFKPVISFDNGGIQYGLAPVPVSYENITSGEALINNMNMVITLGAITNAWSDGDFDAIATDFNLPMYVLLNDVLNDKTPSVEGSYWEDLLKDVPADHNPNRLYNSSTVWNHSIAFTHLNRVAPDESKGYFSGLDYMLLYNLYKIKYPTTPNSYNESSCDCGIDSAYFFPYVVNGDTLWTERYRWMGSSVKTKIVGSAQVLPVKRFHPDYVGKGISTFNYFSHTDYVVNGGKIDVTGDAKVCNKKSITALNSGELNVGGTTPEEISTLVFNDSTRLVLDDDGLLTINDNSRVIIEKGALLKLHPTAVINLKGANSVLEIRGTLELLPNTIFQTIGEGYVLFNIPKVHSNPNIIVNGNNCQMIFEDATGTRPKRLAIGAGTILFPPSHLNLFKIEGVRVEMLGQVSGIKLGCPLHLVNNDVAGTNSDGITVYHLPHTYYITGNNFSYHNRALTFTGYSSLFDIKIRYNQFSNCVNSIVLYQQPAHIGGNYFDNSGGVLAGGAVASAGPIKAGLYRGPLRVELNRFQNSSAVSVNGSSFPTVNLMGNVCNWTSTSPFGKGWGYGGDRATSTLTCNYFENQADAINVTSGGELNLSTNRISNIPTVTGGNITGGNNYFKNSQRSIALFSNGSDAITNVYHYLNNGYNSFDANPALHGSSLNIDRQWNYLGLNHQLDVNGNVVLNNNYFTPLLNHSNYSFPPVNTIEKNGHPGYHFKVLEYGANTPFYLVGTMHTPNHTCPVSYWNDAVANPTSFDPMTVGSFGTNKRNQERPFASDGVTTATVPSGTYMGQNMGTVFNNAVGGVSAPATDPEEGAVLRPVPQGLLNLANLLASTASCTDVAGMSIYKEGYSIYLKTLADAYALNVFEGNTTLENNQITAALAVFTAIDAHNLQFQSTQPNRFYETKLNTRIDKVHVYRAFKRFDDALTVVSDLLSFANSTDQASVMFLNCFVENEKQLKNNVINWLEFEEYTTNCGVLYNQSWPTYSDSTGGGDTTQQGGGTSEPYLTYTLTPNPATDIITVDMDLNIDGNVKIAVFNKFGIKVVNDIPLGELLAGNHTHTVTIAGLPVDVYNMVVYVDNVPFVEHFIKNNE